MITLTNPNSCFLCVCVLKLTREPLITIPPPSRGLENPKRAKLLTAGRGNAVHTRIKVNTNPGARRVQICAEGKEGRQAGGVKEWTNKKMKSERATKTANKL